MPGNQGAFTALCALVLAQALSRTSPLYTSALVHAHRKAAVSLRPLAGVASRRASETRSRDVSATGASLSAGDAGEATEVVTASGGPAARKKRVLLLMSDTGGGHRASAQALVHAMERLYPGQIACDVVDIWTEYTKWPYNKFCDWYAVAAKRPWMWRILWFYAGFPLTRRLQEFTANIQCFGKFKKAMNSYEPDLVVSVHPLCQHIPIKVLKKDGGGVRKTPFVTVVTDLGGAHRTWFHKEADLCFIPSDNIRKIAKKAGLRDDQLRQHGLPLREGFWEPELRSKADLRKDLLGEDLEAPMALVVGGGDGVGGIARVATAIGDELGDPALFPRDDDAGAPQRPDAAVAVICGKNEAVKTELEDHAWAPNVRVKVLGFVSNMHEWMAASDVLVTKAGPGTIAEASTRGLPCLLSSFLPGQEAGNVDYVEQNGFGLLRRKPRRIANTIKTWFKNRKHLDEMRDAALKVACPHATTDIAKELGDILFKDH